MPDRDDIETRLSGIDAPRPLPSELRARIESAVVSAAGAEDAVLPPGLDAPRPLPRDVRLRLERALVPSLAARRAPLIGIAAVLVLVLGLASLSIIDRPSEPADGQVAAGAGSTTTVTSHAVDAVAGTAGAVSGEATSTTAPAPSASSARGTAASGSTSAMRASGPEPPFSNPSRRTAASEPAAARTESGDAGASGAASSPSTSAPPPASTATGPELRVGIVAGDPAQEAGFRAYVSLLNANGGIGNRPVHLVAATTRGPAAGSIVTVNLSDEALVGEWGPRLETLAVPEPVLRGNVFGFASAPERQAHLAADAVFPDASPGATAVIYTGAGAVLGQRVADAIESVLRTRGVAVVRLSYAEGRPTFPNADAAFLSLDTAAARRWLREAKSAGYAPSRGIAGVYSLLDEALVADLPSNARILAPYALPSGDEEDALRRGSGRPLGSSSVHGWATAKSLAVALWRTGADTPAGVAAALDGLRGYDSGLAPPYEVRPGTRSRTPEALLYQPAGGRLSPSGGFRRDPH